MKIFILPLFAGILGIFSIVQTSDVKKENLTIIKNKNAEKGFKHDTVEDSGLTWGLHESLKDCVSCHSSQPEQNSSENSSLIKPIPELCFSCHKDIGTEGQWWHGPAANGECLLCHEPHKANYKTLLKKPVPKLCYQCHEISTLELIKNHTNTSYSQCNDCHENHSGSGKMLLKQNFYKSEAGLTSISKNPSVLPSSMLIDQRGSLAGLKSVKLELILDGSELLKHYGVTEDSIRIEIEQLLQNSGIEVLSDKEQAETRSILQIQIRLIDIPSQQNQKQVAAFSGSCNVYLRQVVELLGISQNSKSRFCTATTWNTDAVFLWGATQVEEGLNKALDVLIGQFSHDYVLAKNTDK